MRIAPYAVGEVGRRGGELGGVEACLRGGGGETRCEGAEGEHYCGAKLVVCLKVQIRRCIASAGDFAKR